MNRSGSGLVAVLFTDLVGSTALMSDLGERAYDELRREHFAALGKAIAAHRGEEVKNTGDGLMAVFPAAADAVDAAVALQQATARQGRKAKTPLALRVGLALGDATLEDGDVFGAPVVEAARLVAAARSGQILATGLVRAVAANRCSATVTDLGPLELKGLPDPVPVCEVAWEQEPSATAVPLPALLAGAGRVFVGREGEMDRLAQVWKETVAGARRIALLAGEPGIGKTRLATAMAASVHADGAVVLAGRCDEDLGVPYQPFVEALRHYQVHSADRRLGRHAGELARLTPELNQLLPGLAEPLRSDPETERYRLFDAVAAWLADVSAEAPALLVLDDLHWAAKPTLLLLRHVLRSPEPMRLLVVATYRDTDIGRGHPLTELLADLRRDGGVERIAVSGLDTPAVSAFLEAAAGHELGDEGDALARAIWSETEGNAFFVTEVLRHLIESGTLEQRDGRWTAVAPVEELGIPEGVRDVVGRRLSRLSDETNRVLALASVVGLDFEPAVVRRAGDLSEESVLSALEEAVAARLVAEVPGAVPRNRFAHALVRATLYDELSGARRVMLHRQVAQAIETIHAHHLDDHLPALANHWARASAPAAEATKAVEYAMRAGDRAMAQLAHDEAATYYSSALELLEVSGGADGGQPAELLIALGEAQRRAGDPAYRGTFLTAARLADERHDADRFARAALGLSRNILYRIGQVDEEIVRVFERAVEAVGPEDSPVRARLLASLALDFSRSLDRAHPLSMSDEALAIARRVGDPATLVLVLTTRIYAAYTPGAVDQRLAETNELVIEAERLGDPAALCQALSSRYRALMETDRIDEADRCLDRYAALAEEVRRPTFRWTATWNLAGRAFRHGRIEEGDRLSQQAFEIGQSAGEPDAALFRMIGPREVALANGSLVDIEPAFAETARRFPDFALVHAILAEVYAETGRLAEARAILERLAAANFQAVGADSTWCWAMAVLAVVANRCGDDARAEMIHNRLAPSATQYVFGAGISAGCVAHYLGLLTTTLERFDEADRHFAAAEAAHEHIDAPVWTARTRLEWARMLLRRNSAGDGQRARSLLQQALETVTELGLRGIERQARAPLEGRDG